jgi:hypothetical protein
MWKKARVYKRQETNHQQTFVNTMTKLTDVIEPESNTRKDAGLRIQATGLLAARRRARAAFTDRFREYFDHEDSRATQEPPENSFLPLRCQGSPAGELQKSDQDGKQENLPVHVR